MSTNERNSIEVTGLRGEFKTKGEPVVALDGVNLQVKDWVS